MTRVSSLSTVIFLLAAMAPSFAAGQSPPDAGALESSQREAMARFGQMDGVWRGTAWTRVRSGDRVELTQTERVGPFLGGAVRVIEGRGYEADGSVGFNALGVMSFDPATRSYSIRSYAMGQMGDFAVTPTEDGYTWDIPAGPMTIRYTAVILDDRWTEVGDRIMDGQEPARFFEMSLTRVGDTDWPAAGAIPAE